jgi:hypothetical protein
MTILAAPSLVACGSPRKQEQPRPRPVQVPLVHRDKHQQPLHLRQPGY